MEDVVGDEGYRNCVHGDGFLEIREGIVCVLKCQIIAIRVAVFGLFQIHGKEILMLIIIKEFEYHSLKLAHNFSLDCLPIVSFRYMDTNGSFGFATSIKESYLLWYSVMAVSFLKLSFDERWSLLPITISASFLML